MATPHAKSVRSADRLNEDLGILFARLGNLEHPRGGVMVAYRNAVRALATVLDGTGRDKAWQVAEVLKALRKDLADTTKPVIRDATTAAAHAAVAQLLAYGIDVGSRPTEQVATPIIDEAMLAIMGVIDGQIAGVQAMTATGASKGQIIGDDSRQGLLVPTTVLVAATFWAVQAASATWDWIASNWGGTRTEFYKQAIAAIDERTTETCLLLNGMVVPLNEDFVIEGTPRYADRLGQPPFHWNCRSSLALVKPEDADDILSQQMRDAAQAELAAREKTGKRDEIHPAHARSRR